MERINNMDVYAINEAKKNRISDLVKQYGDEKSNKLFDVEDYKMYLLLRHLDNLSK